MIADSPPTVGLRLGGVLFLSGAGVQATCFHLGALTRLNELGLLVGIETIRAVAGGSIVAALITSRVPWPLQGAYRDWPESIAEPTREIAWSRARARRFLRGSAPRPVVDAPRIEELARLLVSASEPRSDRPPRLVIGAAGLALGEMAGGDPEGTPNLRWSLPAAAGPAEESRLDELRQLENDGYAAVDGVLREQQQRPRGIEPQPPAPPHSEGPSRPTARPPRTREKTWRPLTRRRDDGGGQDPDSVLLNRHRPFLRYDSLECFRADSVATLVEMSASRHGNALHRGDGTVIATSIPQPEQPLLNLDYLGPTTYADGRPVRRDDYLDERGSSHASDAIEMVRKHGYGDVVYGRSVRSEESLWLQYWFFHYYNDKGFLNAWRHEGDWEMVQIRIGEHGAPDGIACAQQGAAEWAPWGSIDRRLDDDDEAPVIFCARGCHTPRLREGSFVAPVAPDHNDGEGPLLRPRLIEIGDSGPDWARWPGRWGATRRRESFEGESPRGPAEYPQWRDPEILRREGRPISATVRWQQPGPPVPDLTARFDGVGTELTYCFPERNGKAEEPARIIAAVLGERTHRLVTHSFAANGREGGFMLPTPSDSRPRGVRASVCSETGTFGKTITIPVEE